MSIISSDIKLIVILLIMLLALGGYFLYHSLKHIPQDEIDNTLRLNQHISDGYRLWIEQYGEDTAKEMISDFLSEQPEIGHFSIDEKTNSITIIYKNGFKSVLSANPEGTWEE